MSQFNTKSHLDIEAPLFEGKPHIWIQWKGTDVCCDIWCACGGDPNEPRNVPTGHFDGDFFYFFRCPHCGQVWEVGTSVAIYPVSPDDARIQDHEFTIKDVEK